MRNSQIPADEINRDIAFIMGRAELKFENTDQGYRILRKGKLAKNLSKGEENAVALIYFFNTLRDMAVNAGSLLFSHYAKIAKLFHSIEDINTKSAHCEECICNRRKNPRRFLMEQSGIFGSVKNFQYAAVSSILKETGVYLLTNGEKTQETKQLSLILKH